MYFKYRREKTKQLSAQKSNSNTVGFNFQTDIFLKIKPYTSKLNLYSNKNFTSYSGRFVLTENVIAMAIVIETSNSRITYIQYTCIVRKYIIYLYRL